MGAKTKARSPAKKPVSRKPSTRKNGDRTAEFEALLRETSAKQLYELRLYVSGSSQRSGRAIANVRALCEEFLPGRYDLKVIDIYQQPGEAAMQQIIAAPTLIKINPEPVRRMIGDLSDRDKVVIGLNLASHTSGTAWMEL